MPKNHFKILLLLFTFFLSNEAYSKPYFDSKILSPTLIDPPLKEGSAEWKKEVKEIIKLQKNPDPIEIKEAAEERHLEVGMILEFVDPSLTTQEYPKLYNFLERVTETSKAANNDFKNYWNNKRPYLSSKEIKALIKASTTPSYPSGHTSGSYLYAHILGQLIPEKRGEFMARAKEISEHRVLVGMHYPNDLKGGRELALILAGALMENSDFQKDFAEVKKELAAGCKN